ncbi:MAG: thioredoxin family protein [Alphaproteobacteria bacterium]|nr:thioredoxin family protein [Alphaproteobacteria bacterium]
MDKTRYDDGMMMMFKSFALALLPKAMGLVLPVMIVLFGLGQGAAVAATGPWQGSDVFSARLISALDRLGAAEDGPSSLSMGLEVKLAKGWKIYWRSPGDAGLPPELDFSASGAVTAHQLYFPAPTRFSILGFDSFGYEDHVIYPLEVTLANSPRDLVMAGVLTGLICSNVCIPIEETLTFNLPRDANAPPLVAAEARQIALYSARVPRPGTSSGVKVTGFALGADGVELRLTRNGTPVRLTAGDVMVEAPSGYSFSAPQLRGDRLVLASTGKPAEALVGQSLPFTVVTKDWLLETTEVLAADALTPPQSSAANALLAMMMVAFIGGVILNIMPCVLPVISLKLASVITMGGAERGAVRRSFLMTAFGVVVSFVLLGGGLAVVREAGVAIGWGIQFQDPVFLTIAAVMIAGFGLVMLDVVTVPVPAFIAGRSGRSGRTGRTGLTGRASRTGRTGVGGGQGLMGDFLSGFMATLLATPCSAPFVGTALTFAFTTTTAKMMVIFLAMGVGLALPWLMVAALPQLAQYLPKPGRWLVTVKRVLALGLFATSLWLLSILAAPYWGNTAGDEGWQTWRPGLAEELAGDGQVVFVDVTAEWCLTCKANKALVLDSAEMTAAFRDGGVALLRADWTQPDDAISAYLASHDRFGIPFNIVYGPARPDGVVLPELLTSGVVMQALSAASRP